MPTEERPRDAIRLLLESATGEERQFLIGLLALVLAAGLEAIGPLAGRIFIDDYLIPERYVLPDLAGLLLVMLLGGWAAGWIRYAQLNRMAAVARRSVLRLRARVFSHVLALPMAFFDKAITGQLVSRVTNDTEAVNQLYRQVLYVMLDSGIVVLGSLVAMAWLDWRLMLIVAALLPTMVAIIWLYQRLSAAAVAHARELRSDINAQMGETMAGIAVLQSAGAVGRFVGRFEQTNEAQYRARTREIRANAWLLRPALDLQNILLTITLIYGFGRREMSGVEAGLLYAFLGYLSRVVEPLIQITLQFSQLQQSMIAAARVGSLLKETVPQPAETASVTLENGSIQVKQLSFGYNPAHPVVRDLNLEIPAGSFVGIVGHTGSGKSTLLSLLLRFYQAQSGEIRVGGHPLADLPDITFRKGVGLVPQEPFLMAASARSNIVMDRDGISEEDLQQAARAAQIHDFLQALPQGYDTLLGEGGIQLSTGQKQLVAMARALAGRPKILFLDEATANIDSATEQVVANALTALHGQVTVVAIAHRLSTIRDADQILVLKQGEIVERGTHRTLMDLDEGLYRRLVELQAMEE